ncbi:MAG: Hpt domain-containing protein [Pseudomonadota bacterium]|nr:Hpt domain-containing protein [Pseudomonadota bacterium]
MDRTRYRSLFVAEAQRAIASAERELAAASARPDPRTLLRSFHMLKGMSATMEIGPIASLAHALEDVCEAMGRGSLEVDEPTSVLLTSAIARLRHHVRDVAEGREPSADDELEQRIRAHLSARSHTGFRLLPEDDPTLSDMLPVATGTEDAVAALAEMLAACQKLREISSVDAATSLQITRIEEASRRMYTRLAELREVPFGTVIPPMRRRLRAMCKMLGREARLEVCGEDVRVDPEVLGPLQAALVQLLNNAVAHGIEAPADRGGKGPVGRISVVAERVGRRLLVSLEDDGRGLDVAGLRRAAGEPEADPVELALRPGLTTLAEPGPIAGRGYGLPAVSHLVARLGGRFSLLSSRSRGTRLIVEVPLHAELVRLLLVRAAGHTFALVANGAVSASDTPGAAPLLALAVQGVATIRLTDGTALRVDQVLGAVETLVSPPPWPLDAMPHLVGTTIAPEGHILLVIDPSSALIPQEMS